MFKKNLVRYVSYSVLMAAATVGTMTMQPAEKITSLMSSLVQQGDKTEHILTHVSGTEQDKAELKKALNTLSRTQIGQEILSQVPKDIHYVFEETHPTASGAYSKPQKTIKLYREHMTEETPLYITLAHEMRHAVQDQKTLLRIDFINQKDEAIVAKLCELDTKVHDILLEHQTLVLPENQTKTASAPTMFYTALYAQGKKSGLSDKDAAQKAKDALVQSLWSGGIERDHPSSLYRDMQSYSHAWHSNYTKEVELTLASGDAFCEPRKNGVESFINAYRKRLGTELDTSFFQRLPNMTFSTNEKDGSTVSRTYASNGILLQQNKQFYETKGARAGFKHNVVTTYHENGHPFEETHYVNGFKHGTEKIYHENGNLSGETTYQRNILNGKQTSYDINGVKTEEILYQNGEKTCSAQFDSAGVLVCKTEFVNGQPKTEKEYDTDGSLWYEVEFVNGQPSIEKEYDKDGKVVHMQPFNQTAKANTEAAPGSLKKTLKLIKQSTPPLNTHTLQNNGR